MFDSWRKNPLEAETVGQRRERKLKESQASLQSPSSGSSSKNLSRLGKFTKLGNIGLRKTSTLSHGSTHSSNEAAAGIEFLSPPSSLPLSQLSPPTPSSTYTVAELPSNGYSSASSMLNETMQTTLSLDEETYVFNSSETILASAKRQGVIKSDPNTLLAISMRTVPDYSHSANTKPLDREPPDTFDDFSQLTIDRKSASEYLGLWRIRLMIFRSLTSDMASTRLQALERERNANIVNEPPVEDKRNFFPKSRKLPIADQMFKPVVRKKLPPSALSALPLPASVRASGNPAKANLPPNPLESEGPFEEQRKNCKTTFQKILCRMEMAGTQILCDRLSEDWGRVDREMREEVNFEQRIWALIALQRLHFDETIQGTEEIGDANMPVHGPPSKHTDGKVLLNLHGNAGM